MQVTPKFDDPVELGVHGVGVGRAAPTDLDPLFAALEPDPPGTLDGVHDPANMPLVNEPQQVRFDLDALTSR